MMAGPHRPGGGALQLHPHPAGGGVDARHNGAAATVKVGRPRQADELYDGAGWWGGCPSPFLGGGHGA